MNFQWIENPHGQLLVRGCRLEYKCFGPDPSESMTIVLLHEGLGSVSGWRDFPKELYSKTGYGVLVFSRIGYGQSDSVELPRPADFMTNEATNFLPQIVDEIGLRRGILIGHSDGATISAIYSGSIIDHRIRGLVLIAPHFFVEEIGLESIKKLKNKYENGGLKAKLSKIHRNPDNAFYGWYDCWTDPVFLDWNVSEVIDYIRVPVLVVQGEQDEFGTLEQIKILENRIYSPLEIAIIENCGHMPQFEKPQSTLDFVSSFCKRLENMENQFVAVT